MAALVTLDIPCLYQPGKEALDRDQDSAHGALHQLSAVPFFSVQPYIRAILVNRSAPDGYSLNHSEHTKCAHNHLENHHISLNTPKTGALIQIEISSNQSLGLIHYFSWK
ncbi:hypothetical protein [Acaryochloris marina]|uniref:hypothetical protein n=1 Tax=Acaryochloris marina TaxID=155978 RepID=UPI0011D09568|nr:hypothetical protein [Acaryochloris marina]